ncbi:2-dehydropantoate 2-reductase [Cordyceps militaris CM01]|uniref:2-dehydropantoate 2-reductase n=1 Tax=Cordyceps militaris (strain CM01) TaxID=983644 RepID=G3JMB2_CORMM|nr:2-dehydropantoate 2-reductase [Cordyceps militaris CM01]EGX90000.1 2-dehydropantoate 2-reductase [Cordyceps militaris CM01]
MMLTITNACHSPPPKISFVAITKLIATSSRETPQCAVSGAARCYGTVAGAGTDKQKSRGGPELPYRPKQHSVATSGIVEPTILQRGHGQSLYVPSVRLSPEASKSPSVHKIHILGEDARSKFIAHALSGVYDSVERLAWTRPSNKYRYLQRFDKHGTATFEPLNVGRQVLATKSDTHIDELVVSSNTAQGAMEALEAVKHRVDHDTTVCLMTDGLGVLEDVRQKIFSVPEKEPTFLLGNMSHKFAFNRNFDSVRQLRHGIWNITSVQRSAVMSTEQPKVETQTNFVRSLQAAKLLNTEYTPFDSWFRYKLPGVIFDSAVEPVCLLLELPYSGLLQNANARKLISSLLEEIISVLRLMPEIGRAETYHEILDIDRAQKALYKRILRHKSRESSLVQDIRRGHPVNVDYLNGYFLRRAHSLGVRAPTNKMMWDLVKAKNTIAAEQRESYVRIEETSVTPDMEDEYKASSSY